MDTAHNKSEARDSATASIQRQTAAMGSKVFEIGICQSRRMLLRALASDELLRSVPRLSRENANGANIYIRPSGEHNLSMVDDLTDDAVGATRKTGFDPAVVVETSPRNFQAWLKHGVVFVILPRRADPSLRSGYNRHRADLRAECA